MPTSTALRAAIAAAFALACGAAAAAPTLIQAGTLLDKPGQAPRGNSTLVVEDGKIQAVLDGFVGAERYPGATVIDLRRQFVLPGLIDSHVHLVSDRAGTEGALALYRHDHDHNHGLGVVHEHGPDCGHDHSEQKDAHAHV